VLLAILMHPGFAHPLYSPKAAGVMRPPSHRRPMCATTSATRCATTSCAR
jgi:hypothetical protein